MDKAAHLASQAELSGKSNRKDDTTLMNNNVRLDVMRGVEANTNKSKGSPMGAPMGVTTIQYVSDRVPMVDPYDTYEDEMN